MVVRNGHHFVAELRRATLIGVVSLSGMIIRSFKCLAKLTGILIMALGFLAKLDLFLVLLVCFVLLETSFIWTSIVTLVFPGDSFLQVETLLTFPSALPSLYKSFPWALGQL